MYLEQEFEELKKRVEKLEQEKELAKIPELLTIQKAIEVTGLSRSTIDRRIKDGSLPTVNYTDRKLIPKWAILGQEQDKVKRLKNFVFNGY